MPYLVKYKINDEIRTMTIYSKVLEKKEVKNLIYLSMATNDPDVDLKEIQNNENSFNMRYIDLKKNKKIEEKKENLNADSFFDKYDRLIKWKKVP